MCVSTDDDDDDDNSGVIVGLSVGLGVPLVIMIAICVMLCCLLRRSHVAVKPVEAFNRFFPFPSKTVDSRVGTVRSTTSSYYQHNDLAKVYESATIEKSPQYENTDELPKSSDDN